MEQEAERRQLPWLQPPGACTKLLLGLPWTCGFHLCGGQPGNGRGLCSESHAGDVHYVGVEPESGVLASLQ